MTIAVENQGIVPGFLSAQDIFAFNPFEQALPPNAIMSHDSLYERWLENKGGVIHRLEVYNQEHDAVITYSVSSSTRFASRNVKLNGPGIIHYNTRLDPDAWLSVAIVRIQLNDDGHKLWMLYCHLLREYAIVIPKDLRALLLAYVDANAYKKMHSRFEFPHLGGDLVITQAY